jgi:hypothetical protein
MLSKYKQEIREEKFKRLGLWKNNSLPGY